VDIGTAGSTPSRFRGVGNIGGKPKFDLGAGSSPAPDIQTRPDFGGALAHSRESPMAFSAPLFQDVGIDADAVIPDSNPKFLWLVV
jgi:hypothetical protein